MTRQLILIATCLVAVVAIASAFNIDAFNRAENRGQSEDQSVEESTSGSHRTRGKFVKPHLRSRINSNRDQQDDRTEGDTAQDDFQTQRRGSRPVFNQNQDDENEQTRSSGVSNFRNTENQDEEEGDFAETRSLNAANKRSWSSRGSVAKTCKACVKDHPHDWKTFCAPGCVLAGIIDIFN